MILALLLSLAVTVHGLPPSLWAGAPGCVGCDCLESEAAEPGAHCAKKPAPHHDHHQHSKRSNECQLHAAGCRTHGTPGASAQGVDPMLPCIGSVLLNPRRDPGPSPGADPTPTSVVLAPTDPPPERRVFA